MERFRSPCPSVVSPFLSWRVPNIALAVDYLLVCDDHPGICAYPSLASVGRKISQPTYFLRQKENGDPYKRGFIVLLKYLTLCLPPVLGFCKVRPDG